MLILNETNASRKVKTEEKAQRKVLLKHNLFRHIHTLNPVLLKVLQKEN